MAFHIEMKKIAKFSSQMCHEPGLCQLKHLFKMTTYMLLLVWDSLIKFLYKQSSNDWNQSFAWIFHYRLMSLRDESYQVFWIFIVV